MSVRKIRAAHARDWYPIGQQLIHDLDEAFAHATVNSVPNKVKAIIAPHAGYCFCLSTAAYAYKAINPDLYNRVIIIGPSHRLWVKKSTIVEADYCETLFFDDQKGYYHF